MTTFELRDLQADRDAVSRLMKCALRDAEAGKLTQAQAANLLRDLMEVHDLLELKEHKAHCNEELGEGERLRLNQLWTRVQK